MPQANSFYNLLNSSMDIEEHEVLSVKSWPAIEEVYVYNHRFKNDTTSHI